MYEITVEQFEQLDNSAYILIDIRDELAFSYGHLPQAVNIPVNEIDIDMNDEEKESNIFSLLNYVDNCFKEKSFSKIIIYCKKGIASDIVVSFMAQKGIELWQLEGGYMAWLMYKAAKVDEMLKKSDISDERPVYLDIEESIRKRFKKNIWSKFTKAINEYELVKPGDKIAVCISGGKDSMLMAKLFQELKRHNKFDFEVQFLVMDPGYSPENRKVIESNAKLMNIPITVFESDIFESVFNVENSPCYLCARMRRGYLYSKAKELGCNKIALGHHYDDVIETILMGMLYGAQVQTMMPKLHSTNFEGMELIRPLYLVREEHIKLWRDSNNLHFIQCACKFTDNCTTCTDNSSTSKRQEIKGLIRELKKVNPFVEGNIFKSVENVNLSTVVAYKKDGIRHHFLEDYDK
ncbi:MAG: ATPase [Lachnospiraceae bacterium]|nr:ATPase [Lachnospiraceae bacterium]MBQ2406946.1 ATPase [Lachnospiraceae bacterium]MEE0918585.1 ATP-binding protein [Lachnospiraceae bacterium]